MTPSAQRSTADALVAAYNRMDIAAILLLRTPTCQRHVAPASMKVAPQDNAAFEQSLRALRPIFANFRLTVHEVVEDLPARKMVLWLSAEADTKAGSYVNEYMWTLDFTEDGRRLVRTVEFTDSVMQRDFWPLLKEMIVREGNEGKHD